MRLYPILFSAALLASSVMPSQLMAAPNIVLILTDDQGWSQLPARMDPMISSSRSRYLESPHIAALMEDGRRFTSGYSPAPLCTPTRRSILCGTSAARSGTEFASPDWIPADHLTIPKALKAANSAYRTAHFGKWGEQMISTPEECGYDVSDGMTGNLTGGMPKSLGIESGSHTEGPPHFIDNEDPKRTVTVTDRAVAFMNAEANAGNPFYVQVSYYAQHLSVVTRESLLAKYEQKGKPDRGYTAAWAAMLEELDAGVGRLRAALEELDIDDETYVIFTTDNGGRGTVPGGDLKATAPNFPLSGAKHTLMEGGVRVPFIVAGPGIRAGSVCRVPVVGYDFLPTFHALAGGTPDQLSSEVDGADIQALFKDRTVGDFERPQEALFFHRPRRNASAIREGNYKLMLRWNNDGTIRGHELYKVYPNPAEVGREISDDHPKLVEALRDRLLAHLYLVDAERKAP